VSKLQIFLEVNYQFKSIIKKCLDYKMLLCTYTTVQTVGGFGFDFFIWFSGRKSLLCSPKLHLFDQKQ